MTRPTLRVGRIWVLVSCVLALHGTVEAQARSSGSSARTRILSTVDSALAEQAAGAFPSAVGMLQSRLLGCSIEADARGCRILFAYSLGFLHQQQVARDPASDSVLLMRAVSFYDEVLKEDPNHSAARYNKALAYRELGAHEWQESFFRDATTRDPNKRTEYLALLGDYYLDAKRPEDARRAYLEAIAADPDDEDLRIALIEADRARGTRGAADLLKVANEWKDTAPVAAARAYAAALVSAFGTGSVAADPATADAACVGLVLVQQRMVAGPLLKQWGDEGSSVGRWAPLTELERFSQSAASDAAPWWTRNDERREALAHAALLYGNDAVVQRDLERAERFWQAGMRIARPRGRAAVSLQRELALLYAREPAFDPGNQKFARLENVMFTDKGGALISGDLEAAQRFHQTLGLVYARRGVWRENIPARNAVDQLTWALRAADTRFEREQFYQPLPEVHELLAAGLDSLGRRAAAAAEFERAARAYLDIDDLESAERAARARRATNPDDALASLITLRRGLSDAPASSCTVSEVQRVTRGAGPPDFVRRQQFKILSDCALRDEAGRRERALAVSAFTMADSTRTLVGTADVRRLERVLPQLLFWVRPQRYGDRPSHVDAEMPAPAERFTVYLPSETTPRYLHIVLDELIAARVVGVLGVTRQFRLDVQNGDVVFDVVGALTAADMARVQRVEGLRTVRRR